MTNKKGQFMKGTMGGSNNHMYIPNKPKIVCATCGVAFECYPRELESKRKYCNKACSYIGQGKARIGNKFRLGTKQSEEWKRKRSVALKGENHPNWIKDRSLIKLGDRKFHDPLMKQWRQSVKDRDDWACRIADNNCNGRLEVHHILRWSEFPELRYQTNNGITLCHAHHPRKVAEEKRLIPTFQELVSVSKITSSL